MPFTRQARRGRAQGVAWLMAALACASSLGTTLGAQQPGGSATITGRVIDGASQAPVASARVYIVGTTRGTETSDEGRYRLGGLAAGTYQLRVIRIGFESATQNVTLTAGQTATQDFTIRATAVSLEAVTVTATGEQIRQRETGNAVSSIAPTPADLSSTTNVTDLLTSRAPAVYVQQSTGTSGTGSRIRIRGANSVSLNNEPLLIVDGVRVNSDVGERSQLDGDVGTNVGTGGQVISRLNDINPEDIENIDVIKGPAGVALYGTAAANGVVQITTKRGRAGATQYRSYGEYRGLSLDYVDWPANYSQQGTRPDGSAIARCTIDASARQLCTPTSIASFSPLVTHSPFRTGNAYAAGGSASGGTERVTFFTSLDHERETGVFLTNDFKKTSVRGNARAQLRDNWDIAFNTGYINNRAQLPVNDNSVLGIISTGLLGAAFDDSVTQGYFAGFTPGMLYNLSNRQFVDRSITSVTSNYQANEWLSFSGVAGLDLINQITRQQITPNRVDFADLPQGNATSNSMQIFNWTAQGNATANFTRDRWRFTTQLGAQYTRELFRGTNAFGAVLTEGTGGLNGTSARFAVAEFNTDNILIGGFLQQQLSFADRIFLTGALRTDDNSAFGTTTERVYYPSVNASYVVSDESWFPKLDALSSFRVRAAYGRSGQRPQFRNAITFFAPVAVTIAGQETGAISFANGGVGNLTLKPELSSEFETGADLSLFNDRFSGQFTYYNKTTDDALIQRPIPPSVGAAISRFENIGTMRNRGVELQLTATLWNSSLVRFDVSAGGSTNDNKLVELGEGIAPIVFNGGRQIHRSGYSAGGYWQRPIRSFADKNGDGQLSRVNCVGQAQIAGAGECEVVLGDTLEYLGNPLPRREFNVNPRLGLFNNRVRVSALFDHRGGYKTLNLTNRFRCVFVQNCQAINDRSSSLVDQAAALAGLMGTDAGYIEDGAFTRLRELSVTLGVPATLARRLGGDDMSIVLAGRNLALWTNYKGLDPEITSNPGLNFTSSDFLTVPPVRYFTARINLTF